MHDRDNNKLVEPYDVFVAAHGGTVRLWMEYARGEAPLPDGVFYGCEMTPAEAREMAALLGRAADTADCPGAHDLGGPGPIASP